MGSSFKTPPTIAESMTLTTIANASEPSPNVPTLPNEIYIEILKYADYHTLKRCRRVGKAFRAFTEQCIFDARLFRQPTIPYNDSDFLKDKAFPRVKMHPGLRHVYYYAELGCQPAIRLSGSPMSMSHQHYSLSACDVANEFATWPPLTELKITCQTRGYSNFESHVFSNPAGVTVRDVLDVFIRTTGDGWLTHGRKGDRLFTGMLRGEFRYANRLYPEPPYMQENEKFPRIHFIEDDIMYDRAQKIVLKMRQMRKE